MDLSSQSSFESFSQTWNYRRIFPLTLVCDIHRFTTVFEWFLSWISSWFLFSSCLQMFLFCPGAYPPALPLCESTVGLLPPCGVTGQPAPFSPRLFLRSPWSSTPPASFTLSSSSRLTHFSSCILQGSFCLGQQSQGFDLSCGTESPFSVYPADLFPSGVAWPLLRSSFHSSAALVGHWIPAEKHWFPLSGAGGSEEEQLFLNLLQLCLEVCSEI